MNDDDCCFILETNYYLHELYPNIRPFFGDVTDSFAPMDYFFFFFFILQRRFRHDLNLLTRFSLSRMFSNLLNLFK